MALGTDTMVGGAGNDTYFADNAGDIVTESSSTGGTDTVNASVTFTLGSNVETLVLTGAANINGTGNTLANTITGNTGNNALNGLGGADTMIGGAGDDTYVVDNAGDIVTESSSTGGIDTVSASVTYALGANVENLILAGTGNINGTGNALDNTVTGNAGINTLTGGDGTDTLQGAAGADTLDGGPGIDTARFSGAQADYSVTPGTGGSFIVADTRTGAPDGTDTVRNIEFLQFSNITVPLGGGSNQSPVAVADSVTTNEDTVLSVPVSTLTANDSDPDSDPLTITGVGGATNGTVTLNAGNVVFTPASNYNGTASRLHIHPGRR